MCTKTEQRRSSVGTVIQGLDRTLYYLDVFQTELSHELNTKIELAMKPIATKAKGFMPNVVPFGVRNWLREPTKESVYRPFPIFDSAEMKAGIKYRPGLQQETRRGFTNAFAVTNESAAGAIFETAGRKHPKGNPNKSNSGVYGANGKFYYNHGAGERFINALPPISKAARPVGSKGRSKKTGNGRAIFRAWNEDQGKVKVAVIRALGVATDSFNAKHTFIKIPK